MPLYDFQCDTCGNITEELISPDAYYTVSCFNTVDDSYDDDLHDYYRCPGTKIRLLSAPVGIKVEGGYETDMVCRKKI